MLKIYLILGLLISIALYTKASDYSENNTITLNEESEDNTTDLCHIRDNASPLLCSCNMLKLECWVFKGLTKDPKVWSLFLSIHQNVTELKLTKRTTEDFTFVPIKLLKGLRNLHILHITCVDIHKIQPYSFSSLTNLRVLKLTNDLIFTLEHHAFANLPELTELHLQENMIVNFKRNVFVGLQNLKKLDVSKNNLGAIEGGCFEYLGRLVEMKLDSNILTTLTTEMFIGLGQLKNLDLNRNKISRLENVTFKELWELEDLNLEYNQITFISDRTFTGLTHLKKINLAHNRINQLSIGLLRDLSTGNYLDLRWNKLETLTMGNIEPIIHNFANLRNFFYVTHNEFVCDCNLEWMYTFRQAAMNPIVRKHLNEMTCYLDLAKYNSSQTPASYLASKPEIHHRATSTSIKHKTVDGLDTNTKEYSLRDRYGCNVEFDTNNTYINNFGSGDDEYDDKASDKVMVYLFDIPLEALPCPGRETATESPPNYVRSSGSDEVEANGCRKRILIYSEFTLLLIILVEIYYIYLCSTAFGKVG